MPAPALAKSLVHNSVGNTARRFRIALDLEELYASPGRGQRKERKLEGKRRRRQRRDGELQETLPCLARHHHGLIRADRQPSKSQRLPDLQRDQPLG